MDRGLYFERDFFGPRYFHCTLYRETCLERREKTPQMAGGAGLRVPAENALLLFFLGFSFFISS